MNFLRQGFWKLSSDRHSDRQIESTKITNHAASRMVENSKTAYRINKYHEIDSAAHTNAYICSTIWYAEIFSASRLVAVLVTMQTSPVIEQNKNVNWSDSNS